MYKTLGEIRLLLLHINFSYFDPVIPPWDYSALFTSLSPLLLRTLLSWLGLLNGSRVQTQTQSVSNYITKQMSMDPTDVIALLQGFTLRMQIRTPPLDGSKTQADIFFKSSWQRFFSFLFLSSQDREMKCNSKPCCLTRWYVLASCCDLFTWLGEDWSSPDGG